MKRNFLPAITMTCALGLLCGCAKHQPPATSDLLNTQAALHGQLPYDVLHWKPMNVSVERGQQTTSTLFANSLAVACGDSRPFPDGSQLALVTWSQREDPHWFGARIPGEPTRVEVVEYLGGTAKYHLFSGSPLMEQAAGADEKDRIAAITAMRPIALP